MKRWPLLLLFLTPLLLSQKAVISENSGWVLSFDDEFNGALLDLSRWSPHDPWVRAPDRQLQAYVPDALQVAGGQLHIVARREENARGYVSGIVSTFGAFAQTYGRFEIRCRTPSLPGLRAGFRLLPVPLGPLPEIDVFEIIDGSPSKVFFANRWGTEQTQRSYGDSFTGPDLSTGFHTVAMEWDRDRISWFIDGKEKFKSVDGVPRQPMYLQLDLVVGGSTQLPASFDIDYIRVYRRP